MLCRPLFLHKAGSASCLSWKSSPVHFHVLATILLFPHHMQVLLVRITRLWLNHDGRIMFQKFGSIHCNETGCNSYWSSLSQVYMRLHCVLILDWEWGEVIRVEDLLPSVMQCVFGNMFFLERLQKLSGFSKTVIHKRLIYASE